MNRIKDSLLTDANVEFAKISRIVKDELTTYLNENFDSVRDEYKLKSLEFSVTEDEVNLDLFKGYLTQFLDLALSRLIEKN